MESYLARRYPHGMPEPEARRFLCQIASAFQYLSQRGLSHRDLKPANMLLTDWSKGGDPDVKIADFGFARRNESATGMMYSRVGSPLYMAPEVLSDQPYTSSIDVWSTGIIFIQLLTGTRPFPHARVEKDIVDFIADSKRFRELIDRLNISDDGKQAVTKMLTPDPRHRLSWDAFLELDYVRPSVPKPLDASVLHGVPNWVLIVTSFETGMQIAVPVTASTQIEALRAQVARVLLASNASLSSAAAAASPQTASDLMLLTPRNGAMLDGCHVGDYFKPPQSRDPHQQGQTSPLQKDYSRMDNMIHACFKSAWEGIVPVWEMPSSLLSPPSLSFTGGMVPNYGAAANQQASPSHPHQYQPQGQHNTHNNSPSPSSTISPFSQLSLSAMSSSPSLCGNPQWHAILSGWKFSVEDHLEHARDLQEFTRRLNMLSKQIAAASNRKAPYLALTNFIRSWTSALSLRFEIVARVIREVSPAVTLIRRAIPAMLDEAKCIPLAPLCAAFPTLTVDPSATLLHLLNEHGMRADLDSCVKIHKNMLAGELMLSKSSDVDSAVAYGIPNAKYSGNSFSSAVAVATQQPQGVPVPELILTMVDINSTLSNMKFFLGDKLLIEYTDCGRAIQDVESIFESAVTAAGKATLDALAAALQKPPSFDLTSESMGPILNNILKLSEGYSALLQAVKVVIARLESLSERRVEFDLSCAEVFHKVASLRVPFLLFESKFSSDWSPKELDFVAAKSKSLARLVEFPQAFKDILAEIERRRNWGTTMNANIQESRSAYDSLIKSETDMRESWYAAHSHVLHRFRDVFPQGFEILHPTVPGSMSATLALNGILAYPQINSPFSSASSSSSNQTAPSASSPSSSVQNIHVPMPQNPTEEELARRSSRSLLEVVFNQRRELDQLIRQRTSFFQSGIDVVLKQENTRLTEETETQKAEISKLQADLSKALTELERFRRR